MIRLDFVDVSGIDDPGAVKAKRLSPSGLSTCAGNITSNVAAPADSIKCPREKKEESGSMLSMRVPTTEFRCGTRVSTTLIATLLEYDRKGCPDGFRRVATVPMIEALSLNGV